MSHSHDEDPACAAAHGHVRPEEAGRAGEAGRPGEEGRTLVAVFASPVADHLLRFGVELGFRPMLLEPDPNRGLGGLSAASVAVVREVGDHLDGTADVVVTDHHRAEIGPILRDVLGSPARWIGIMGSPRHEGPHVRALTELGVPPGEIARVHRPIGLNIGSRTPPEIAVATLAGLIADRNGRPGGFAH
ncbi:XdhC family protein [Microbispora rosea]|uniref:XdhC family protein n=1 Tax=Microbispora rosea TaxID=58117 RepID=UPI0037C5537F